jgi:hypothetical protein
MPKQAVKSVLQCRIYFAMRSVQIGNRPMAAWALQSAPMHPLPTPHIGFYFLKNPPFFRLDV